MTPTPEAGDAGARGNPEPIEIRFDEGTLVLRSPAWPHEQAPPLAGLRWDQRVTAWRAPAWRYASIILTLRARQLPYDDQARAYQALELLPLVERAPRPFQLEALEAWRGAGRRGVVVLPTGVGKSHLGLMALGDRPRSTLVVAPTIDLMNQWYDLVRAFFGVEVGVMGGGSHDVREITVTTYDSAQLHLARLGARFGLIIFDECHHLPGPSYSLAARTAIAPFRLGLTATPERPDGRHSLLDELIGPQCFRRDIKEMAGAYLAEYETEALYVDLDADERARYEAARQCFRGFVDGRGLRLGGPGGWQRFLIEASRSEEGRAAFAAWREQRRISMATPRKLALLGSLLTTHSQDRVIVFTNDNRTAYDISRRFLVPTITHQTRTRERHETLERFNDGRYPVLVTSKVLNEGVNVPEANVGVILSGSATVREHVQRLGRLLRKVGGKRARLYEVIARGTSEETTSDRRRQHDAYR